MPTRIFIHLHVVISESALFVGQCAIDQHFELLDCERLKSKNLRSRHECAVNIKEWIVSGRADEAESPCLDVWQENVLLRLVEMMDLINEQDRLSPGRAQTICGCSDNPAHFGDIAFYAADPDELCVRHFRNDPSQCGLAAAGRPGENHRGQTIGFNGTAQQFARRQDVLLADELVERARTHARGKRRTIGALDFDVLLVLEKILHEGNYRLNTESAPDFRNDRRFRGLNGFRTAQARVDSNARVLDCPLNTRIDAKIPETEIVKLLCISCVSWANPCLVAYYLEVEGHDK
jgi:hypothetical protein